MPEAHRILTPTALGRYHIPSLSAERGASIMTPKYQPAIKIVLSDLHIGAGRVDQGNLLEDFVQDDALIGLISQLEEESQTRGLPMELVLNGDIFEFWQVPAVEENESYVPSKRYAARRYLRTREEDSCRRMRLIIQGHPSLFAVLARFIQSEAPRRTLTIIKGNHDVQLHWEGVQTIIRQALGATKERYDLVLLPSRSISREGVYIEHGSEYADAVNRHPNFDLPHHPRDPRRLRMVPGATLSIRVINRLERQHYWVTSVKPTSAVFWYLLRYDPWTALRMLVLALPLLPRWLWLHRPATRTNRQLARELRVLEAETQQEMANQGQARLPRCQHDGEGLAGLINLPSLQAVLDDEESGDDPLVVRGLLEEHSLHARLKQVAKLKVRQEQACVVIFGHTHLPAAEPLEGGAVYINTGSWTWMLDLREQPAQAWRRLIRHADYGDIHHHLTYARVDYDNDSRPRASLREAS